MISSDKSSSSKKRKRTVAQILKDAYGRHCRDRDTRDALRQQLKK